MRKILFFIDLFLVVACQPTAKKVEIAPVPNVRVRNTEGGISFQNGVLTYQNQPFSGWLTVDFLNGQKAEETPFLNGKEEGWATKWYENGQIAEKRLYKNGKKEGLHESWWSDGKPRFAYQFENDLHHGFRREWYASGSMATQFNYAEGQEVGRQEGWYENGKMRFNYEVRNGRLYGLTGVKNCMTVWDETTKKFIEKRIVER